MTDIQLAQQDDLSFFYNVKGADLVHDDGLETAVIISLFTDARVSEAELPPGTTDKRGWWGDLFATVQGDRIGSKLWTLERRILNEETARDMETYAKEALDWLVGDNVAASVEVSASVVKPNSISLSVKIQKPDGTDSLFDFLWNGQALRRA